MNRLVVLLLLFSSLFGFEIPHNVTIPDGAYGIWQCPATNTDSPLYFSEGSGQSIIDAEDSACINYYGQGFAIHDHNDSKIGKGIWNVNRMVVGGSAFLITEEKTEHYICTAIYLAERQTFSYVYDGHAIRPKQDQIVCVSCAQEENMVYLAVYDLQGVMP